RRAPEPRRGALAAPPRLARPLPRLGDAHLARRDEGGVRRVARAPALARLHGADRRRARRSATDPAPPRPRLARRAVRRAPPRRAPRAAPRRVRLPAPAAARARPRRRAAPDAARRRLPLARPERHEHRANGAREGAVPGAGGAVRAAAGGAVDRR